MPSKNGLQISPGGKATPEPQHLMSVAREAREAILDSLQDKAFFAAILLSIFFSSYLFFLLFVMVALAQTVPSFSPHLDSCPVKTLSGP